jgi:hypothetical protein
VPRHLGRRHEERADVDVKPKVGQPGVGTHRQLLVGTSQM